jgi:hypothetical protein
MTFAETAREAFRFLTEEHGFVGPRVEPGSASISLEYTGDGVGVRVEFDTREQSVDVVLVRLNEKSWPPRYQHGWLYLDRVARSRGIRLEGGPFNYPQGESDVGRRVREEARVLRALAGDLLRPGGEQIDAVRQTLGSGEATPEAG